MSEYFDIHSHILPSIDDGAINLDHSKKMLHMAYEHGIRHIIATPHFREGMFTSSKEEICLAFNEVSKLIESEGLDITLYLGSEIYYSHNICSKLLTNEIHTMADSNYVLVEFNPGESYTYIRNALQDLIMNGYWPILAHFERYVNIVNKEEHIDEVYKMGVCIQINASTITGPLLSKPTRLVRKLLKYDMVHFIATDTHNTKARAPLLKDCIDYLHNKYGQEYVNILLYINPMKIINNQQI